jgi:hypothetical protein
MPEANDKCVTCGHPYAEHATDMHHSKEKCWHGACIGETCECREFLAK